MNRTRIIDDFRDDRLPGRVVGSAGADGTRRGGVDAEGVLSVDHGALRVAPLAAPGWGRSGLSYGPLEPGPGFALYVLILNGHHASQTYTLPSVGRKLGRWWIGSGEPWTRRVRGWIASRPRMSLRRKLLCWWRSREGRADAPVLRENLAIGWFRSEGPRGPGDGPAVVVATADAENGELRVNRCGRSVAAVRGIQNLPLGLLVVHRPGSVAYYAGSLHGVRGLPGLPRVRPLGIDPGPQDSAVYAGVHQAVLGEIGFFIDTRVFGVRAAEVDRWSAWFGTAHAAATLNGVMPEDGVNAEPAGTWREWNQGPAAGARVLQPAEATGLVHVMIQHGGVVFRAVDERNFWCVRVADEVRLEVVRNGAASLVASAPLAGAAQQRSLQVLDDGAEMRLDIDGVAVGDPVQERTLGEGLGVGLLPGTCALAIEAHPRAVELTPELHIQEPWQAGGGDVVLRDDFGGPAGELQGRRTASGPWERSAGTGSLDVRDGAAHVRASREAPFPGRTIFTIPWTDPTFADLRVTMTPPGTRRGENHRGRSGLVVWQDADNYILWNIWLHDGFGGVSLSTFLCLRGFDDIFDAVWTNMGAERVTWGVPFELAAVCDGERFLVRVNGEPVLYRAIADVCPRAPTIRINRVGLASNWEWGTDTGTVFRDFTVRGRSG